MKTMLLIPIVTLLFGAKAFSAAPAPLTPPNVLGKARTIQFTATLIEKGKKEEISTASLSQPNKAFVQDVDAKTTATDTVYASDGITQTEYRKSRKHYVKTPAPVRIAAIESRTVALSTLMDFYDRTAFAKFKRPTGGIRLYRQSLGEQDGKRSEEWLQVDAASGLPKREFVTTSPLNVSLRILSGAPAAYVSERIELTGWKLNATMDDSRFSYKPPTDAKLYVVPKLLADGAEAPDFSALNKSGKPVRLSDYRGEVVVLDFWATWCGPCQMSLPHTTRVAKKNRRKGVAVLALNVWDTPKAFRAWLPKHPQYETLNFAIDPAQDREKGIATGLYGVSGIPTQYVIGRGGRIVKSIVGYEPGSRALESALKSAGVK